MGIINRLRARASNKRKYSNLMKLTAEEKALERKKEDAARRVVLGEKAVQQRANRLVLEKRGARSITFMQDCVRARKKLTPAQQETLQKNLDLLDRQISNFLMGEGDIMLERDLFPASKIRVQVGLDLKERLIEETKALENKGLVKSGFVSNTFYVKKPIRK